MAPPKRSGRPPSAGSNAGAVPADVLRDVLLWIPARELCRLRAVCRDWRSLTSEPLFVREHAARHPVFLANPRDDPTHIHVLDLSGNVVKRIPNADGHQLLPTRLDLVCAATVTNSCRVIVPATGWVRVLPVPESPEVQHLGRPARVPVNLLEPDSSFALGTVSATGEYKVLRMFSRPHIPGLYRQHPFEVYTSAVLPVLVLAPAMHCGWGGGALLNLSSRAVLFSLVAWSTSRWMLNLRLTMLSTLPSVVTASFRLTLRRRNGRELSKGP